ncbi:MAG: hypothetical protein WDN75_01095 [Bacteroidota bacterium]
METYMKISQWRSRFFIHVIRFMIALGIAAMFFSCGSTYVASAPPPPIVVRPVAPYAGAVWVEPGYRYRRGVPVYINGYYVRPRPGRSYYPGEWRSGPRGYYYHRGRWR